MSTPPPTSSLQLRSLLTAAGTIELSLVEQAVPAPGPDEVVVRVEATPINPSDLGVLLGPADLATATQSGTAERPVLTATIPEALRPSYAARVGQSMPVGNEGAGTVVAAGANAQALLGKTVALFAGGMYAQHRVVAAKDVIELPAGTTALDGASAFVNPLTALGFVGTMRREGHTALVHTAAASSLGQMLGRVCREDGVPLVCVVRRPEQAALLRAQGAEHVCDSSAPTFKADLEAAIAATGATLAFDATGGGPLAGQILQAMETVLTRDQPYTRYGSPTHKQAYLYGVLDPRPLQLPKWIGMAWGVGGWLLTYFLQQTPPAELIAIRQRIAGSLKTTFATSFAKTISLAEAVQLDEARRYTQRTTGGKVAIDPSK